MSETFAPDRDTVLRAFALSLRTGGYCWAERRGKRGEGAGMCTRSAGHENSLHAAGMFTPEWADDESLRPSPWTPELLAVVELARGFEDE